MKIKKIIYQNRRDFKAVFVCECCGTEETRWGYDDLNFHQNVIPKIKCEHCGKIGEESDDEYIALKPKYDEGYQI